MSTVTAEFVAELIDFAPDRSAIPSGLGRSQIEGVAAIYNMLVRNRCAYLADEVGMGKTYVALGVMGLVRYFNPKARILVIAPRENIQLKWRKELHNFVRLNWKHVDNKVKSLQGDPEWEPVVCDSLTVDPEARRTSFAREALLQPDRDFLLRMTSFSLALKEDESRQRLRKRLRHEIPWLPGDALRAKTPEGFRDAFGCALNAAVPEIDLVIVDEAHNLKHGFRESGSIRNRVMGLVFGHPEGRSPERPWYQPERAQRVLLLSATPFEDDYGAIQRQFEIFGFGKAKLVDAAGGDPRSMADLLRRDVKPAEKREIVRRLMVRRVSELDVGGRGLTKNMYRREWRRGGYDVHDEPMEITDPKERLVVALMQKKVAEVLQDERFNNNFQIGMLSSFESFLETVNTRRKRVSKAETPEDEEAERVFDGDQTEDDHERRGIDTEAIAEVLKSYQSRFRRYLPHPKLDATSRSLESCFDTGEKSLVFVRRVRTVYELTGRLDAVFDRWIRWRMEEALPDLHLQIGELFALYEEERRRRPDELIERFPLDQAEPDSLDLDDERRSIENEDRGSAETFFAWFFRGEGPRGHLSGAAFQKNRLAAASSAYSIFFEDDYTSWLLGHPDDVIGAVAAAVGRDRDELSARLRDRAFSHFRARSKQKEGYPRRNVFEGYQIAALEMLEEAGGEVANRARIVAGERYPGNLPPDARAPEGFPGPAEAIGVKTFFTELANRPALRERIWPEDVAPDFRMSFRRREQRRELISAMARLGASYIDLYLLALRPLGSFELKGEGEVEHPAAALATAFADLLERQSTEPGFHAFYELSSAAASFDLLLAVNFPTVPNDRLSEIARTFGNDLQRQVPVGGMSGGVNKRLVKQFRMPGFPLVLATTDVLQEGEDLHTFCARITHYGITWTASAMEQRTGRIDRIGSLVQRRLQSHRGTPTPEEFIQVYYPHLKDTVEVLQVRRVLKRLNRFFELIHETSRDAEDEDSKIDAAREMLEDLREIEQFTEPLKSAFPILDGWRQGTLTAKDVDIPDLRPHYEHFEHLWQDLQRRQRIQPGASHDARVRTGIALLRLGGRYLVEQAFRFELRSQIVGAAMLLRCVAEAGDADLVENDEAVTEIRELSRRFAGVKVCAYRGEADKLDRITTEGDLLFNPAHADIEEVETVFRRVTESALRLARILDPLEARSELAEMSEART